MKMMTETERRAQNLRALGWCFVCALPVALILFGFFALMYNLGVPVLVSSMMGVGLALVLGLGIAKLLTRLELHVDPRYRRNPKG
jgi:hypothetical protein